MDVEFEEVTFKVRENVWSIRETKPVLKGVSGRFEAGHLSAILGPSGAGKSSLLNSISGFRSRGVHAKSFKVNGQPRDEKLFRKLSCYITQEEVLQPLLSLQEVMMFAADLKLPSGATRKQKSQLVVSSIFITLLTTPSTHAETLSSTTDLAEISTRAGSASDSNTTQEQEWQSNESNQQDRQSAEKVVSTVASLVQKYHQDGSENLPEHDYHRRFLLDSPQQNQYDNDLYHRDKNQDRPSQQFQQQYQQQKYQQPYQQQKYQKPYQQQYQQKYQQQQYQRPYQQQFQEPSQKQQYQQNRIRDETYPVAIHGCGHSMDDGTGPYSMANSEFPNRGVLQSWLAGSGWRGSHSEDDKYPSQPLQVTTATPKTAHSYRNRDYTKYDFNHQDKRGDFYQSRYTPEIKTSTTREYNSQVQDFQRPPPTWMQPYPQLHQQRPNRNNRIVYYEYNLEDRRPGSGRCHPMDRNCGSTAAQYDSRWYAGGSSGQRSYFDDGSRLQPSDEYYYRNQQPYYSRPEGGRTADSREPQVYDYLGEDYYRYRNDRRDDGSPQNLGIGYVYSVDLPVDRAISPSTAYAYDAGFGRKNQDYKPAPVPHLDS